MRKDEIAGIFNGKIREFLNDLIIVYPNDDDLKKFKASINVILVVSDTQLLSLYKDMVYDKYKNNILNKDEDFFLKHDYHDVKEKSIHSQEFTDQLIEKIKSHWSTMTVENKRVVWTYFILLTKLCEKYYE